MLKLTKPSKIDKNYSCATRSSLTAERVVVLRLHDTVAKFRTGVNSRRCDSHGYDILWWYHVNKYRAMRGNRSELAPAWNSPRCHVNTPLRRSSRSEHWIGLKKYSTLSLTKDVTTRRVSLRKKTPTRPTVESNATVSIKIAEGNFDSTNVKAVGIFNLPTHSLRPNALDKQYNSSAFKHQLHSYFTSHCVSSLKDFSCITLAKTLCLMWFHSRNEYYFRPCRWL